jgi:hypothetical protein
MKIVNTILFIAFLALVQNGEAQGFVNLDFEAATVSQTQAPGNVSASDALPDWNAYYGGNQQTQIGFNAVNSGIAQVALLGTNGVGETSIEGSFSVFLQGTYIETLPSGRILGEEVSITQSGLVLVTAQSIFFKAQPGTETLLMSLAGQNIPFVALASEPNYTLYGGDVSAYANQSLELAFTVLSSSSGQTGWNLDSIEFSSQPVPEPSEFALGALGALLLGFRRKIES